MPKYLNRGGDSPIVFYELARGVIEVTFADGSTYRYTDHSAGAANVARMWALAEAGLGLNRFLEEKGMKARFACRWR